MARVRFEDEPNPFTKDLTLPEMTVPGPEPTEPELPPAPDTAELGRMREEAAAIPVPEVTPEKEANLASTVSQAQRVTGFDTSVPEQPESQARERADKLLQRLDEFQRTDFGAEMQSAVSKLREDRAAAESQVRDRQQREQMIHAIGKMAAGLIGLASLQDKQSRGIDLGDIQFEKTDFKSEYDRLFRNYLADTEAVKERIGRREKTERGEIETLGTVTGLAAREAEGEADRQLRLLIEQGRSEISRKSAQQALQLKQEKEAAKRDKSIDALVQTKQATFKAMQGLATNQQFQDMDIDEAVPLLNSYANNMGVPKQAQQQLETEVYDGWNDNPAEALARYLRIVQEYANATLVTTKDGQMGTIPNSEIQQEMATGNYKLAE